MPQNDLVDLVCDFYREDEIVTARDYFYNLVQTNPNNRSSRKIKHHKMRDNVSKILDLMHQTNTDDLPQFVAGDIRNIPSRALGSADAVALHARYAGVKNDIQDLKADLNRQMSQTGTQATEMKRAMKILVEQRSLMDQISARFTTWDLALRDGTLAHYSTPSLRQVGTAGHPPSPHHDGADTPAVATPPATVPGMATPGCDVPVEVSVPGVSEPVTTVDEARVGHNMETRMVAARAADGAVTTPDSVTIAPAHTGSVTPSPEVVRQDSTAGQPPVPNQEDDTPTVAIPDHRVPVGVSIPDVSDPDITVGETRDGNNMAAALESLIATARASQDNNSGAAADTTINSSDSVVTTPVHTGSDDSQIPTYAGVAALPPSPSPIQPATGANSAPPPRTSNVGDATSVGEGWQQQRRRKRGRRSSKTSGNQPTAGTVVTESTRQTQTGPPGRRGPLGGQGTKAGSRLGLPPVCRVLVRGLAPDFPLGELTVYVKEMLGDDSVEVTNCWRRSTSAFVVTTAVRHQRTLYDCDNWESHVSVCKYYPPRQLVNSNSGSVSSATVPTNIPVVAGT